MNFVCPSCKRELSIEDFYSRKGWRGKVIRSSYCKECARAKNSVGTSVGAANRRATGIKQPDRVLAAFVKEDRWLTLEDVHRITADPQPSILQNLVALRKRGYVFQRRQFYRLVRVP